MADRPRLHIAFVIPPFSEGSGGHNIIFQLMLRLERAGHTCSVWVDDPFSHRGHSGRPSCAARFASTSPMCARPSTRTSSTGTEPMCSLQPAGRPFTRRWRYPTCAPGPTSSTTTSPSSTHIRRGRLGRRHLPPGALRDLRQPMAARPLRQPLRRARRRVRLRRRPRHLPPARRRAPARHSRLLLPLDHPATGRRARRDRTSPAHRRRPDVRIVMFGERHPLPTPFPYEQLGVASPEDLSWLFSEATVGLCLSMTN